LAYFAVLGHDVLGNGEEGAHLGCNGGKTKIFLKKNLASGGLAA
jgi:hypothetical protein